ncbi:MAG: ChaN family lipoprotein [Verrucomicrobiota bacterium]|nr:ChaN family lipoprotein [Verrucomicrobiota bacterium]
MRARLTRLRTRRALRALVRQGALLAFISLAGCAWFARKPPLPRSAAIEHAPGPAAATDYKAMVEQAEVIYFPEERAASAGKSEPAALLLEALAQSGKPFGVGSDLIDATQQPLLDEIANRAETGRENLIAKVELNGTGRAREHYRSVLRDVRGAHLLALRPPTPLLEKVTNGENVAQGERNILPTGFTAPRSGFESYAERFSGRGLSERSIAAAYRAQLLRRQFAAETIVRFFHSLGSEARLVVFASAADFAEGEGIPFYVSQKLPVRQLVLGPEHATAPRGHLLTRRNLRPGFEVVDRAPVSARN